MLWYYLGMEIEILSEYEVLAAPFNNYIISYFFIPANCLNKNSERF